MLLHSPQAPAALHARHEELIAELNRESARSVRRSPAQARHSWRAGAARAAAILAALSLAAATALFPLTLAL